VFGPHATNRPAATESHHAQTDARSLQDRSQTRPDIPLNRLKPVFPLVALDFSPARTPFPSPSRRVETRRYSNSKRAEARSPVGRDRGAPPTVALYTMLVYREPNNVSMPPADPP